MYLIQIALGFAFLVLVHFIVNFRAEARRQRIFSWPRVTTLFRPGESVRLKPLFAGSKSLWSNQLLESYQFYVKGELLEGNKLLLKKKKVIREDQEETERRLNRKRRKLKASYNPEAPEENTLLMPHRALSWWGVSAYLFFGVVLPFVFVYLQPVGPILTFLEWQIAN